MEKTTVYLTAPQKAALTAAAAAAGRSEAQLIRAGIDAVTGGRRVSEAPVALGPDLRSPEPAEPSALGTTQRRRPRWLPRDEFVGSVGRHQADPALASELRELAPDTTDEIPMPSAGHE